MVIKHRVESRWYRGMEFKSTFSIRQMVNIFSCFFRCLLLLCIIRWRLLEIKCVFAFLLNKRRKCWPINLASTLPQVIFTHSFHVLIWFGASYDKFFLQLCIEYVLSIMNVCVCICMDASVFDGYGFALKTILSAQQRDKTGMEFIWFA